MDKHKESTKRKDIEEIIGKAKFKSDVFYLVKWVGLSPQQASWEKACFVNGGWLDTIKKDFNMLIKDKTLPFIAEKYADFSDKYIDEFDTFINQRPTKKIPQKIWGKEKRGFQMFYLVQHKNESIENSVWMPRFEL